MTNVELKNELEKALQQKLKSRNHIESGSLYNSISFSVTDTQDGPKVELSANDYIQYLDKGNFLKDFFASDAFLGPYGKYISSYISNTITDSLQS
jgi:hypothetical protein